MLKNLFFICRSLLFVWAIYGVSSCEPLGAPVPPTPTPVALQQLRITNEGSEDIHGLVVLFPGSSANASAAQTVFGDIPAGATTAYQDISSGVYRYAAYRSTINGQQVTQPVVDWMGETPLRGQRFTYRIASDSRNARNNPIQLLGVAIDAP